MKKYLVILSVLFTAFLLTNHPKAHATFIDKDCKDFTSKQALMEFWYSNGYSATNDPHNLDGDHDGYPCEVSYSDYSSFLASKAPAGWKQVNGKWYYYDTATVKHIGWLLYNHYWYYFDSAGNMKTGWVKVASKWYFFNSNGAMKTGWLQSNGKWYYLLYDDGMSKGWVNIASLWYYFDDSGVMKTGWVQSNGKWYFLQSSGAMKTGWAKISNQWYYLDQSSGAMKTGWVKDGVNWYYLNPNGTMKTGWLQLGEKWYFLQSNGVMATGNVGGYWFDKDGVWIQYPEQRFVEMVTSISQTYGLQAVQMNRAEFSLQKDGVEVGYVIENGVVYLDKAYKECAIDLARSMESPPPVTDDELFILVDEALTNGSASTDEVAIELDGDYLGIYWNAYY